MIVTIKPHSVFNNFFTALELRVDMTTYYDILFYLQSMQPKFINYLLKQKENNIEESYVFLDKNLREMTIEELQIRRAKDGDIIHIVPAIVGGGGKRGGLLAILAVAAFFLVAPLMAGAAAAGAAAPIGASVATAGGVGGLLANMSPLMSNLVVNIGLALISSLFASSQKAESTRENDAFGSLVNSTNSGTPVALHYGLVRVAGQLISGYVSTVNHGRNEEVNVYGEAVEVNK